jgi:hypothetical protein
MVRARVDVGRNRGERERLVGMPLDVRARPANLIDVVG